MAVVQPAGAGVCDVLAGPGRTGRLYGGKGCPSSCCNTDSAGVRWQRFLEKEFIAANGFRYGQYKVYKIVSDRQVYVDTTEYRCA
ncbi:hypothetical protein [Streptomyces sp. NPDC088246]|uniref:hypothetical protein n=1 Tax=Streptomyces sp. NPDC088246 TaxID=3365842 RepID=UPI00382DE77E